jgi:hypothetical protein
MNISITSPRCLHNNAAMGLELLAQLPQLLDTCTPIYKTRSNSMQQHGISTVLMPLCPPTHLIQLLDVCTHLLQSPELFLTCGRPTGVHNFPIGVHNVSNVYRGTQFPNVSPGASCRGSNRGEPFSNVASVLPGADCRWPNYVNHFQVFSMFPAVSYQEQAAEGPAICQQAPHPLNHFPVLSMYLMSHQGLPNILPGAGCRGSNASSAGSTSSSSSIESASCCSVSPPRPSPAPVCVCTQHAHTVHA